MVAAQRPALPAGAWGRPSLLMPSGSLQQFEALLGHPGWFRHGTALAPWPAPMPDVIAMADDLMILGNIASHGRTAPILASLLAPGGPPHTPGMAATLALAPTVADALDLLLREIPRRNPFIRLDRADDGRRTAITLDTAVAGPARVLVALAPLLVIHRQLGLLLGDAAGSLLETDLDGTGASHGVPALLAGAGLAVRWGVGINRLSFPHRWLEHANTASDPVLWALARQRITAPDRDAGHLAQAVAAHVAAALASRKAVPRLEEAAAAAGMSQRTLVRRLGAAGLSFTALVEQERRTLALLLLRERDRSLQEIAEALGFPDAGRFGRAFRKWMGVSPARFRRDRLQAPDEVA